MTLNCKKCGRIIPDITVGGVDVSQPCKFHYYPEDNASTVWAGSHCPNCGERLWNTIIHECLTPLTKI